MAKQESYTLSREQVYPGVMFTSEILQDGQRFVYAGFRPAKQGEWIRCPYTERLLPVITRSRWHKIYPVAVYHLAPEIPQEFVMVTRKSFSVIDVYGTSNPMIPAGFIAQDFRIPTANEWYLNDLTQRAQQVDKMNIFYNATDTDKTHPRFGPKIILRKVTD